MNVVKTLAGLGMLGIFGITLWAGLQLDNLSYFVFFIGIGIGLTLWWLSNVWNNEVDEEEKRK